MEKYNLFLPLRSASHAARLDSLLLLVHVASPNIYPTLKVISPSRTLEEDEEEEE